MIDLKNKTRKSESIPKRLLKEGRIHLIPTYYMMLSSYLAKESIQNSGSYKFADHIYVSKPKGRYFIGLLLDKILLSLPSSRSFKKRYEYTRDQVIQTLVDSKKDKNAVLSIPSGIPRELAEAASHLKKESPEIYSKTIFYCVDGDRTVLEEAERYVASLGLNNFTFIYGDALDATTYPQNLDCIVSTGFNEFISDQDLSLFFNHCTHALCEGGVFATTLTRKHGLSDYLMRHIAELHVNYRNETTLQSMLKSVRVHDVEVSRDSVGYQILMKAIK